MKFRNVNTNEILTGEELESMHLREYKDMWENDLNIQVEEFKEDGKTFEEYVKYMKQNDIDTDFEVIEE